VVEDGEKKKKKRRREVEEIKRSHEKEGTSLGSRTKDRR
jgi:hypothetical protein